MQFSTSIASALLASIAAALPVEKRGTKETYTFDDGVPEALTLTGYTLSAADTSVATVSGLTAVSSPNVAFTNEASGFPPIISGGDGVASSSDATFTLDSFYMGTSDYNYIQVLCWQPSGSLAIVFPAREPVEGGMGFVDVAALNNAGCSGISSFNIKVMQGNFERAHAIDNLSLTWDA